MLGAPESRIRLRARGRRSRGAVVLAAAGMLVALVAARAWAIQIPDVRGDQLLFVYDTRANHSSFVNVTNPASDPVVVEIASYPQDLTTPVTEVVTLEAGGEHIVDLATAFGGESNLRAGLVVVTPIMAADKPIPVAPPSPLAGSFTMAGKVSAFGENAFARSIAHTQGGVVKYETLQPGTLMIPVFYDPQQLDDPGVDGNRIVLVSFVDVYGEDGTFRVAAPETPVTLRPTFCVSKFGRLEPATFDVSGVNFTTLQDLASPEKVKRAGSLFLEEMGGEDANLFGVFSQAKANFAAGQRLPAADEVPACPTPGPTATATVTPIPGPTPTCGNGKAEAPEECDKSDLGTKTTCLRVIGGDKCEPGGVLTCRSDCTYDLSQCSKCTCDHDSDCNIDIDCSSVSPGCKVLDGACQDGRCVPGTPSDAERTAICTSNRPGSHDRRCK
jgi:hypothetical protein